MMSYDLDDVPWKYWSRIGNDLLAASHDGVESGSTEPLDHCSQKPMCSLLIVITDGHYSYLNRSHRNTRFRLSRMSVLMKFSVERSSSDHQPCAVVVVRREDGAFLDRSTNWNGFYTHLGNAKKLLEGAEIVFRKSGSIERVESCSNFPDQNESWPFLTLKKFIRMFT